MALVGPGERRDRLRVLAFGSAGLLLLVSVSLIALPRFGFPVPAAWVAVPAILAQLAALAGLASLYVKARRNHVPLARAGLTATLISAGLMVVAAVWLILAGAEGPPAAIPGLAAAFVAFQMVAFLANSGALLGSGRAGRLVALCFLVPPLLSAVMMIVALVRGIEAALRLDIYTNTGTGLALLCVAAILWRRPALQS